ncbi:MAG: HU family DNA-binding protein, partial [Desulfobacterales bacterium]
MIVDAIHEQLGYPKNKSAEMLETLLELIKSNLEKGEDVLISGFG